MLKQPFYIMKSGRLSRHENTVYFENEKAGIKKAIPIEKIDSIFAFGELDMNTKLVNFLAQNGISIHFFNYYGFYTGSFCPRKRLVSGNLVVKQAEYYLNGAKRLELAKEFIRTAIHNIGKNLLHYKNEGKDVDGAMSYIEGELVNLEAAKDIPQLMSAEGRARDTYYRSFGSFLRPGFEMTAGRVKRPPDNPINCMISFGNSLAYRTVLSEIYATQLDPTISFLHEPGERRFSLSLDISEVFKPIIVDRLVFSMINNRLIDPEKHFMKELNFCYLNEEGRKLFVQQFDEKLRTTIRLNELKRNVSYRKLMEIECYKLMKHILGEKAYSGFRSGW